MSERQPHPLLAAAALRHSRPSERATLHGSLARMTNDGVQRARHLALASSAADPELAEVIADAASVANARYASTMARPGMRALFTSGTYLRNAWGRIMPVFVPKTIKCGPRAQTKNTAPMNTH